MQPDTRKVAGAEQRSHRKVPVAAVGAAGIALPAASNVPDVWRGDAIRLARRVDGKLWLSRGGNAVAVDIVRCFPWSEPGRLLSLRNAEGEELAFISDLGELDAPSRAAVEAALCLSRFVLDVLAVLAVEEDFELRSFSVVTRDGPRCFQTALDAWPRRVEGGGLVFQDVFGDLYRIADPKALSPESKKRLWAFVD